jgi:4a-hydroxytetrahydrobiopterin dehydratase
MGRRDLLSDDAITAALTDLAWTRLGFALYRRLQFASFREAIAFVDAVAAVAEAANHHPDIDIRFRTVELRIYTHSRGGITEMDFELARQIDALAAARQ